MLDPARLRINLAMLARRAIDDAAAASNSTALVAEVLWSMARIVCISTIVELGNLGEVSLDKRTYWRSIPHSGVFYCVTVVITAARLCETNSCPICARPSMVMP